MIDTLMADVLGDDPGAAERATAALVELGVDGALPIIAAIEGDDSRVRSPLLDVLLAMEDPELVPRLCELLDSSHTDLSIAAFELLGSVGDQRVFGPLTVALNDELMWTRQCLAASALGRLGHAAAIAPLVDITQKHLGDCSDPAAALEALVTTVEEEWEIGPLLLLPKVAVALARLGRQDLGPVMVLLAGLDATGREIDEMDYVGDVRQRAVSALCHVAGPGMVSALSQAAEDANPEIRGSALEGLFYLGLPESVESLLQHLDDESLAVRHNAMIWLNRITGQDYEPGETPPKTPRIWWKKRAKDFHQGVCHRLGRPWVLSELIEAFDDHPNAGEDLVREVYITSGKDLRRDRRGKRRSADFLTLAKSWIGSEAAPRLAAGKLYKYGVDCEMAPLI